MKTKWPLDTYIWLNIGTHWTEKLSTQTVLGHGDLEGRRAGLQVKDDLSEFEVDDTRKVKLSTFRQDWSYSFSDSQYLQFGFRFHDWSSAYDYSSRTYHTSPLVTMGGPPVNSFRDIQLDPKGEALDLYLSHRMRITESLVVEPGIRWDRQTWTNDSQLSPRFNIILLEIRLQIKFLFL